MDPATTADSTKGHDGGELSLPRLLATLTITTDPQIYIFTTLPASKFLTPDFPLPIQDILMIFREPPSSTSKSLQEAQYTLILPQSLLSSPSLSSLLTPTFPCKMLTCAVHSSLAAVGFMATLSKALTEAGISCNPVSGFYHDHLFVPVEVAERAVEVLEGVARGAREGEKVRRMTRG